MVYQPPVGARDLLPLDVAQKRWIEDRLQSVFHGWGYHRIITSTIERLDTLMAGGAVQRSTVIQLQELEGEALGLRPELTASIARTAVTRMAGTTLPQRLYYNANVFRRAGRSIHNRQQEFFQAGVELIGGGGIVADAEILLLVVDCIASVGLTSWHLVLGEAGLTRSLLSSFPPAQQQAVRTAIARLDRITLESLPLAPHLRDRALTLLDLRGRPADVLQRVSQLELEQEQQDTIARLKSLVELLESCLSHSAQPVPSLVLDLSLVQTFDYYTGIVFEAIGQEGSTQRVLGQGGRYDQLLGLYHPQSESLPGIGFSLNIEDLHQVLLSKDLMPDRPPVSDWLVVAKDPASYAAAFAYAQTLRQSNSEIRAELEMGDRDPSTIRDYARTRGIRQIAWVSESATETEAIEGGE